MKHLFLSVFLASAFLFSFSFTATAQIIPDDEGEVIIINIGNPDQQDGLGRSFGTIPLTATLYRTLSYIEVAFLNNIGEVTTTMTNETTGSHITTQVNSSFGEAVIPVSLGSGSYRIDFYSSDGAYFGFFTIL